MKKSLAFALFCSILLCMIIPVTATENVVYISQGDSVSDALNQIAPGSTLILREGTYKISEPIYLQERHKNITIRGEGKVTITGRSDIPFSSFENCSDTAFLDALTDQSARDKIVSVDMKKLGITDLGSIKPTGYTSPKDHTVSTEKSGYPSTLTYNDKLLSIARYPNDGYVYIKTVENLNGEDDTVYYTNHRKVNYTLSDDTRYQSWNSWGKNEYDRNGIWTTAYFYVNWADTTTPAGINEDGSLYGFASINYPGKVGQRLFFFNVPEELDSPGEWYLNRETGILYLYPTEEMKNGDSLSFAPYNNLFFNISSANDITIENIRFCGTNSRAVYAANSNGIIFDNCEFTDIGHHCIYFDKCYRSGAKNSNFHDLGSFGIYFASCGDTTTLTSGECVVYNCNFERFSTFRRTYSPAIQISSSVGTHISHCKFNDAPHFAIRYEGNNTLFEYNEFTGVCLDTADAGAIYTGRRWNTRGNIIRYNYFHDLKQTANGDGVRAVYLDDCSSSTKIHGNVFYNVGQVALMAGGRYNEFTNNLLINCEQSVNAQSRGTRWVENHETGERVDFYNSLRNSLFSDGNKRTQCYFELDAWKEAYPEQCRTMLEDMPSPDNRLDNKAYDKVKLPKYNKIKNNITYNTPDFTIDDNIKIYGTDVEYNYNVYTTDIFEKKVSSDFTLDKNSFIFEDMPDLEFIPFREMGLVGKGPDLSANFYAIRTVATEDFVFESLEGTPEDKEIYDFPKFDALTKSGSIISTSDLVKNNYDKYTETFDWKKEEGLLGFQRVSGLGDITPTNRPGRQNLAINRQIPLYRGSSYKLSFTIANPEDLTSDRLQRPHPENGFNDSYSSYITISSSSADASPFSASEGAKTTSKSFNAALTNNKTKMDCEFLNNATGFGVMTNGTKPFESGNIQNFSIRLFFGDIMAYFDKMEVIETTPYSTIDIKQSPGGSATLSGYTVSEDGLERIKLSGSDIKNGTLVLESNLTAELKLTPDAGRKAEVKYNDVTLPIADNTVSLIPSEGGTLNIRYVNEDPAATTVFSGEPALITDYKTATGGFTHTSENAIVMYGTAEIGKGREYKESGCYVTMPGGKTVYRLPFMSELIDDTFTVKLFGKALIPGTYSLKPYLVTDDNEEHTGEERTLTISDKE